MDGTIKSRQNSFARCEQDIADLKARRDTLQNERKELWRQESGLRECAPLHMSSQQAAMSVTRATTCFCSDMVWICHSADPRVEAGSRRRCGTSSAGAKRSLRRLWDATRTAAWLPSGRSCATTTSSAVSTARLHLPPPAGNTHYCGPKPWLSKSSSEAADKLNTSS